MDFEFRHFSLNHQQSTMKVGTDAILLAATLKLSEGIDYLDVGTGCGLIALMIAQRSANSIIKGIDIDAPSIAEAKHNFTNSPWSERLTAECISFQDFVERNSMRFDHILSNPPFFTGNKLSIYPSRTKSRHTVYLQHEEFLELSLACCKPTSMISVILPSLLAENFINHAENLGFHLVAETRVRPKSIKAVNRLVLTFSQRKSPLVKKELVIYDDSNNYTLAYRNLCKEFLLLD